MSAHTGSRARARDGGTDLSDSNASLSTGPASISILSTPGRPSAREGPVERIKTGLFSARACLTMRKAEKVASEVPRMSSCVESATALMLLTQPDERGLDEQGL